MRLRKMKKSKISILLLLMVMILAISAVSAADADDTSDSAVQAVEEAPIEEVASDDVDAVAATDDADVLAADGDGTNFTSLQNKIDSSNTICYITNDYTKAEGDDVVTISKDISIVARGGTFKIDANNNGGIFKINRRKFQTARHSNFCDFFELWTSFIGACRN